MTNTNTSLEKFHYLTLFDFGIYTFSIKPILIVRNLKNFELILSLLQEVIFLTDKCINRRQYRRKFFFGTDDKKEYTPGIIKQYVLIFILEYFCTLSLLSHVHFYFAYGFTFFYPSQRRSSSIGLVTKYHSL